MRAKCINNSEVERFLTIGKVYDVISHDDRWVHVLGDDGLTDGIAREYFELLPDEKPSEWMSVSQYVFVNMITGMVVVFYEAGHEVRIMENITSITEGRPYLSVVGSHADAFAALVGYTWKEG